ncbi:MAG: 3-deoxy-manno-octulosonate cytidylyltransferase [Fimbriimonas sp.]
MRSLIVIPARMASTRFPGKPLCDLLGKPMIQWVYERALASNVAEHVLIATPDQEIIDACKAFGAEAIQTRNDHPSGTDRIAEVSQSVKADVYINVQGDEPLIRPESICACAEPLLGDNNVPMGSVYGQCPPEEHDNPAVVKVATDWEGYALYFSRYAIPYPRNERALPVKKHVGIYAYRYDVLQAFARWTPSPLETTESLEQLRFLEHGVRIKMSLGEGSELAVDTPEQAEEVRRLLKP